jgi:hypothetical protein
MTEEDIRNLRKGAVIAAGFLGGLYFLIWWVIKTNEPEYGKKYDRYRIEMYDARRRKLK